ncbi:hypothetical protein, partial [Pseudoruegeria sp. SK021]|uniref:hypothetical protein n=1 Tax=Pseudoruegeria sp. SK021 TaxID=1933035 RepID=UPI0019807D20
GVELSLFHPVDPPEIGDNPQPGLAGFVSERLDYLKIAATAALSDARKHGIHSIRSLAVFKVV